MEVEEVLEAKIAELKRQTVAHEDALRRLRKAKAQEGDSSKRFYLWSPIDAIRLVLSEEGQPLPQKFLHDALVRGGITVDRARGEHNVILSFKESLRLGKLKKVRTLIGLPEWEDEMFNRLEPRD